MQRRIAKMSARNPIDARDILHFLVSSIFLAFHCKTDKNDDDDDDDEEDKNDDDDDDGKKRRAGGKVTNEKKCQGYF